MRCWPRNSSAATRLTEVTGLGLPFSPVVDDVVLPQAPIDADPRRFRRRRVAAGRHDGRGVEPVPRDGAAPAGRWTTSISSAAWRSTVGDRAQRRDRRVPRRDAGRVATTTCGARSRPTGCSASPRCACSRRSRPISRRRTRTSSATSRRPSTARSARATRSRSRSRSTTSTGGASTSSSAPSTTAPGRCRPPRRSAWTAMAHNGSPGHDGIPAWPAYSAASRQVMELGPTIRVLDDPGSGPRELWAELWSSPQRRAHLTVPTVADHVGRVWEADVLPDAAGVHPHPERVARVRPRVGDDRSHGPRRRARARLDGGSPDRRAAGDGRTPARPHAADHRRGARRPTRQRPAPCCSTGTSTSSPRWWAGAKGSARGSR